MATPNNILFLDNLTPIAFFPYTSGVTDRILEIEYNHNDSVHLLQLELIDLFNSVGIKCAPDNKIVFEFYDRNSKKLFYVGFYDNKMSVGFSFWTEHPRNRGDRTTRMAALFI